MSTNINEALRWAREYLSHLDVPEPYMEGEYLLIHVLGCQRKDLLIHPERVLTSGEMKRFSEVIERRGRRGGDWGKRGIKGICRRYLRGGNRNSPEEC